MSGRIFNSMITKISGFGAGLSLIYCFFYDEFNFEDDLVFIIDSILSISFVSFFFLVLFGFFIELYERKNECETYSNPYRNIISIIFGFFLIFLGWEVLETFNYELYSPRSLVAIGSFISSFGVFVLNLSILDIFRRKENA
jgi:hypothetical protein